MEYLKNTPRLSFLLGGKPAFEQGYQKEQSETDCEIKTVYRFACGLTVTNITKLYPDFGAHESINYFENTGRENTPLISELWDCDISLPCPHAEVRKPTPWIPHPDRDMFILNPRGSDGIDETDFSTHFDNGSLSQSGYLFPNGSPKKYKTRGGRSSGGSAPFFNIYQNGKGYFFAVGWTGQWNAQISRTEDSLHLQSKIEDTHFVLYPGEKIRTSSALILPYTGSVEDSQNLWRRFLRGHIIPQNAQCAPLTVGFWGGTTTDRMLARIEQIDENHIPNDVFWIDAGWCGENTLPSDNEFEGDWSERVGDWEISRHIHPNALRDVAEKIKETGRKFVLWFEPERVRYSTRFAAEHPELLLRKGDARSLLLDLGKPEALDYCIDWITKRIEDLDVDCYRQDFNMDPLEYWRGNDTEDRQGITEIKHIMGLYTLWDTLLERFPKLFIDNCASGGKRLDIEMMKRSTALWRSDAQCPADPNPEVTQVNNVNFSLWMPYSGTGSGRVYDTYRMRSAYATGGLSTTYSYSANEHFGSEAGQVEWLRDRAEEYCRVRPYFQGDLYPLTKPTKDETAWCAVQWHRPESGDGMIQVFKRENSPYTEASFDLCAIDSTKTYRFTDIDGGEFEISGQELIQNGLKLRIAEKRVAKIYFYQVL
ncbi:MAG: alpha-galactosidase [Clostridia bacterium]|nr:alpha-galactosidase [Clostridia bacterium]